MTHSVQNQAIYGGDLEQYRHFVEKYYLEQDMKMSQVLRKLQDEHGLRAISSTMLKRKLRAWKMRKTSPQAQSSPNGYPGREHSIEFSTSRFDPTDDSNLGIARHPRLPHSLQAMESILFTTKLHVISFMVLKATPESETATTIPVKHRPACSDYLLPTSFELDEFRDGIYNALAIFGPQNMSRMVACIEKSCNMIQKLVKNEHPLHLVSIILTLQYTNRYNMSNLGQILLKQIHDMAVIVYGPGHAYSVFTLNLAILLGVNGVVDVLLNAYVDALEEALGEENPYTLVERKNLSICGKHIKKAPIRLGELPSLQFKDTFEIDGLGPQDFRTYLFYAHCQGLTAFDKSDYELMERVFTPVSVYARTFLPGMLLEGNFYAVDRMLCSTALLGYALTMQGKIEAGRKIFMEAVSDMTKVLGSNHTTTIYALGLWARSIEAQGQYTEAHSVYRMLDVRLGPYILKS